MIANRITLILGRKGSGKSYYAGSVMEELIASTGKGFFIADYGSEHLGLVYAHPGAALVPVKREALGRIKWGELVRKYHGIVAFPYKISNEDFSAEMDKAMHAIMDVENRILLVEEVHNLAPLTGIMPGFARIVNEGRKYRIDLIACSLRPANIHKSLIAQADEYVLFQVTEPNALDYLQRAGLPVRELPLLAPRVGLRYVPGFAPEYVRARSRRFPH